MAKFSFLDIRGKKKVPSAFGNVFICSGAIGDAKTVTFPDGYLNGATPEPNIAFKVVFVNGHNAASASSYLSLNGIAVVSNQNGTLAPIPRHAMTEGGSTVYKVLDPNTTLEMYYTADYDGNQTPAFVIVGNPLVLSSATYSIYANGQVDYRGVTHRVVVTNNYSQTVNDMTVDGKLGALDLFFYNGSNPWRSGDTIGVISDPNLRPKYDLTVGGFGSPRFSATFPVTYQIKTSGEIIINFVSSSVTSVGELNLSCVIPLS